MLHKCPHALGDNSNPIDAHRKKFPVGGIEWSLSTVYKKLRQPKDPDLILKLLNSIAQQAGSSINRTSKSTNTSKRRAIFENFSPSKCQKNPKIFSLKTSNYLSENPFFRKPFLYNQNYQQNQRRTHSPYFQNRRFFCRFCICKNIFTVYKHIVRSIVVCCLKMTNV